MRRSWPHCSPWGRLGCIGALIALPGLAVTAQTQTQTRGQARAQGLFDSGPVSFTAAQAARGKSAYEDNCSSCHGRNLDDGQFGPPVKGPDFLAHWHSQGAAALFSVVATKMPPAAPDSLDGQTYADIEAYILQQNGATAGTSALVAAAVAKAAPPARRGGYGFLDNQDATYQAAMARREALLDKLTPVTAPMLRHPPAADWLMWRGTYGTTGYSRLEQINARNAADLRVAWTLTLPASGNEITPLVHDGVLFIESANTVEALDGTDGSVLWQYVRALPPALHGGAQAHIKALAIYQDKLYAPTADGHMVALDVKTGRLIWDTSIGTAAQGGARQGEGRRNPYTLSGGPIVADGKVIVGVSLALDAPGGDFIVALDAQTGRQLWRFNTIARPGQPGGDSWNGVPVDQRYGGGVWTVGSFDPDLNLVYFGVGNTYDTGTLLLPHARRGDTNDALYTDSTLALDPDTGKLVWYYQHMNRDVWDMDWVFEQSLLTLPVNGRPSKLLVTGGKLAIFDALDRASGKYQFSRQVGRQNLVVRIDPRSGAKIVNPADESPKFGQNYYICPSTLGERNWIATSFDPTTAILYVPLLDACMNFHLVPRDAAKVASGGDDISRSPIPAHGSDGKLGRIEAINLRTGKVVWTLRQRAPIESSMLASAGGVIFSGSHDRKFHAYDSATGKLLWQTTLNSAPSSSPVTYDAGGEQYVAVVAGGGSALDAVASSLTPEISDPSGSTTLWVFKLRHPGASGN